MKQQATIFSDVFVEINRNNDKLVIDRSTKQLKPTISRGVAEIYSEVERVFANVKTLIPYIPDYELITTKERLATYYKKIKEVGYVALDTETNGLDPITDNIAGFSIYTKGELPAYIPLTHAYYDENVSMDVAKAFMNALVRDNIKILMHNSKFDIRVIKNSIGVRLRCHFDTYLAARLLNENEEAGLKYLWPKYVKKGKAEYSFADLFENVKFSLFDPSKVYQYAALDALMTWELWEFQRDYLDPTNEKCKSQDLVDTSSLFYDIEMEVSDIAVDMEERGLRVDVAYAKKLEKEYTSKMYAHEKKAQTAIMAHMDDIRKNLTAAQLSKLSNPVNISSPAQLAIILYHGLKLELSPRVVKKGKIHSTDSDALEYLTKTYPQYSDILVELTEYKGYIKLIGTYIVGIPKLINPKTDRVHTEWKTIGADTGRFSSKNPNF